MALSMDEQRILDEIERGLASADPALATRMSSFGAPRRIATLRMRRLRLVASLMTLVVVASVSLVVYALVPFRTAADRHAGTKASSSPAQAVMTAPSHKSQSPAQASAAPASVSPASPELGTTASASAAASLAPSTHAGASASPAAAHQQPRSTPAQ